MYFLQEFVDMKAIEQYKLTPKCYSLELIKIDQNLATG